MLDIWLVLKILKLLIWPKMYFWKTCEVFLMRTFKSSAIKIDFTNDVELSESFHRNFAIFYSVYVHFKATSWCFTSTIGENISRVDAGEATEKRICWKLYPKNIMFSILWDFKWMVLFEVLNTKYRQGHHRAAWIQQLVSSFSKKLA